MSEANVVPPLQTATGAAAVQAEVSILQIFLEFLIIGATSFGGVVPYLRRNGFSLWLCQSPGMRSSYEVMLATNYSISAAPSPSSTLTLRFAGAPCPSSSPPSSSPACCRIASVFQRLECF